MLLFSQKEANCSVLPLCILFWMYTNLKAWGKNIQEDHSFFLFSSHTILKTFLLCYLTKVINFYVGYLWYPCFSLQDKYSWKLIVHSHIKIKKPPLFIPDWSLTSSTCFVYGPAIESIACCGYFWVVTEHVPHGAAWLRDFAWTTGKLSDLNPLLFYSKHVNPHWNRTWISVYFFVSGFYSSQCT